MTEITNYQDTIIQRVKKLRETEGISQAKASEILGISRGQVSNIENPNYPHKYTLRQINTLCKALNCPIEKIFLPEKEITPACSKAINSLIDNIVNYE
jgi:transcriptional regulator with XRE-family HTH domain